MREGWVLRFHCGEQSECPRAAFARGGTAVVGHSPSSATVWARGALGGASVCLPGGRATLVPSHGGYAAIPKNLRRCVSALKNVQLSTFNSQRSTLNSQPSAGDAYAPDCALRNHALNSRIPVTNRLQPKHRLLCGESRARHTVPTFWSLYDASILFGDFVFRGGRGDGGIRLQSAAQPPPILGGQEGAIKIPSLCPALQASGPYGQLFRKTLTRDWSFLAGLRLLRRAR